MCQQSSVHVQSVVNPPANVNNLQNHLVNKDVANAIKRLEAQIVSLDQAAHDTASRSDVQQVILTSDWLHGDA